jgi:hypothetical protein
LPTATEIQKCLRLAINFVDRADLRIESKEILTMRLIPFCVTDEVINEMPFRENGLRSSEDR